MGAILKRFAIQEGSQLCRSQPLTQEKRARNPFRVLLVVIALLGYFELVADSSRAYAAQGLSPETMMVATSQDMANSTWIPGDTTNWAALKAGAEAAYAPVDPATVQRSLAGQAPASSDPLVVRLIYPVVSKLYVDDIYMSVDHLHILANVYTEPIGGGPASLIVAAESTIDPSTSTYSGSATGPSGTEYFGGPSITASCSGCNLASLVGGIIIGYTGADPFTSFFAGTGADLICQSLGCQANEPASMSYSGQAVCSFSSCNLNAYIQNGSGTGYATVTSLCDTGIWDYPPTAYAWLDTGGYASEVIDSGCASLPQSGSFNYTWTHYSSEPNWAVCTTSLQLSVTVEFSNGSFESTNFAPNSKEFLQYTCPGYTIAS